MGWLVTPEELSCCGNGGAAVGAEFQVAAVVEHDVCCPTPVPVAVDLAYDALRDAIGRGLAPIGGDGVPEHGGHAEIAGNAENYGTTASEGWAKPVDADAGNLLQRVAGAGQLFFDAAGCKDGQVGVGPGVVADRVAGGLDGAYGIGHRLGVAADQKEGCADVVLGQNVE